MTNIEWTDKTWNPITGCTKVSPGCKNCYAEGIADRFFAKQYPPNADGSLRKFTDVRCHPERLNEPLRWKKPCMVFVNSMSDLFHEDVPVRFIAEVFDTMACGIIACRKRHEHEDECGSDQQHIFQILTKRPERMFDVMKHGGELEYDVAQYWPGDSPISMAMQTDNWPLSNVWLGVSVELPKHKDRIDWLRETPAAVRFLSVEPQLGDMGDLDLQGIDWVICGGESGPGARMFRREWAESLLAQCRAANVAFFMKQFGSYPVLDPRYDQTISGATRRLKDRKGGDPEEWPEGLRVREFPQVRTVGA